MRIAKAFWAVLMISILALSIATAENSASTSTKTAAEPESTGVSITFGSGWLGLEDWGGIPTQWMQSNATIIAYSPKKRVATLSLNATNLYNPRTLEIFIGNTFAVRKVISSLGFVEVTAPVLLAKGNNTIRLHVPEGCERPLDIKEMNNSDPRCMSIAVRDFRIS